MGDIGIQATTGRGPAGEKQQAYDILLRGGLGPQAAIGRPVARRVPSEELEAYVERLVAAYLAARRDGETFQDFCRARSDEELLAIMEGR